MLKPLQCGSGERPFDSKVSIVSIGVDVVLLRAFDNAGMAFLVCGGDYECDWGNPDEFPKLIRSFETFARYANQYPPAKHYYAEAIVEALQLALQLKAGTLRPPFRQRDWERWRRYGNLLRDLSTKLAAEFAKVSSKQMNAESNALRAAKLVSDLRGEITIVKDDLRTVAISSGVAHRDLIDVLAELEADIDEVNVNRVRSTKPLGSRILIVELLDALHTATEITGEIQVLAERGDFDCLVELARRLPRLDCDSNYQNELVWEIGCAFGSRMPYEANCDLPSDSIEFEKTEKSIEGLNEAGRTFTWGGVSFGELTPTMMDVLKRLHAAFLNNRSVSIDEMENLGVVTANQSFYKVFTIKRSGKKSIHPVRTIIVGRGSYRLVDPEGVDIDV